MPTEMELKEIARRLALKLKGKVPKEEEPVEPKGSKGLFGE